MKKWVKKIISKLVKWFKPKHRIEYQEELPVLLNDKTIYIVGHPDNPWLIAFKCPCGCNSIIHLNLLVDAEPKWRFRITSKKRLNISPSVWRTKGCNSHFFVRNSKIDWVGSRRRSWFS
jgi:Family of unknown function (DUF6527)